MRWMIDWIVGIEEPVRSCATCRATDQLNSPLVGGKGQ